MRRRRMPERGDAHAELERTARLPRAFAPGHEGYIPGLSGIWLRRPLVFTALSLLAGDMIALSGQISLRTWVLGALIAGAAALGMALAGRPRVWLLLICVVMLGGLAGASVMTAPELPPEGECYLTGRVVSVDKDVDDRLVLDMDRVTVDGSSYKGKLRLTLYREGAWDEDDAEAAEASAATNASTDAEPLVATDVTADAETSTGTGVSAGPTLPAAVNASAEAESSVATNASTEVEPLVATDVTAGAEASTGSGVSAESTLPAAVNASADAESSAATNASTEVEPLVATDVTAEAETSTGSVVSAESTPSAAAEPSALPDGFAIGAQVSLFGEVYLPQGQRGEDGFDYRAYLMRRGVYACASGELAAARFEPTGTLWLSDWCYRLRAGILARLDVALGEQSTLARGIMLGDSDSMPDALYDSFQLAGFSHILAVSGMHMSFVIMLLGWVLAFVPGWLRTAAIGLAVMLYCALTGFTPSVVRAGVMGMTALGVKCMGLRYDGPSALALAAIVIVAVWPGAALDTGFALSFMAVLAIYAYYPAMRRLLPRPGHVAGGRLSGIARVGGAAVGYVCDGVALTASVMLGLMPLTSAYFGQVNVLSLVTSPVGIASGMGLMCLGWLTVLTYGWSGPLGELIAALARLCALITERVAGWTAGFDWGIVYMRAIDAWWLCAFVPLMLWASRYRPLARAWRNACICVALALTVVLLLPPRAGDGLDYVLVDVGQGDGQLLTDGASAVVIDVGVEDSALVDYVRRRGLRVEALIITHLHDDHAGALEEFARVARVKRVYLPEGAELAADADALEQLEALTARGVELARLSAGDVLEPISGLELKVLHPTAGTAFDDPNDYSLVIRCEYAGRSVLITGDLTAHGEDFTPAECDVLKVAHHGSAGSSTLEFLAAANPHLALISASAHNSYGLPSAETLARLDYMDVPVLSTADCGDITVHISPDGDMTARGYLSGMQ
ncbi:MAG TPA: DNA internalization-related competence protein ComEC/Rec2 [Candidatus Fimadaptatus faecigallinarum]|uniref:DNA internalization-related competence protein ComEC/Rec2 n=1 Tax=Candidatus Fimadaptatus faecigallinarum TaxID=2840814 RepID=A0A9D1S4F8_9FIRM|nr:DNA internalization-related competence protein ComEC/Rec2 [Candidatus Fimadaptatus faecigallinarum]